MNYNTTAGHKLLPINGPEPVPPTLSQLIARGINAFFKSTGLNLHRSGSYSNAVVTVATFTVTFGGTQPDTNYQVVATASNLLSASDFYIDNKTTTTFDLVYLVVKTGTVAFDWTLIR